MTTDPTYSCVRTARRALLVLALAWSVGATAQLPGVSFVASRNYPVAQGPRVVAAGDFNGDGKPDLATANSASNSVSVLINNGDGTYITPVSYSVGSTPVAIAIGDFDGDGKLDIIVVNRSDSSFSVLLGNGDGTFQAQRTTSITTGNAPDSLAIGDFNGDGSLDVAVTVNLPQVGQRAVAVLLGNGDGTFQAAKNYDSGSGAENAIVADFNGDSKLDIAVTDSHTSAISVLLGNGDGIFQASVNTATTFGPSSISAADFNGDGKVDIVLNGNPADPNVYVLLGNGNGTFGMPLTTKLQDTVTSVSAGDLNGDGVADVIALTADFGLIASLGNGDGTFRPGTPFELSSSGAMVPIIADLNGDGAPDLAAIDNLGVSIALGNGDGTFQIASTLSTPTPPNIVLTSDINGDGNLDVVLVGGDTTGYVDVLLGNGNGTFQAPMPSPPFSTGYRRTPSSAVVGDLNRDGKPDLVVGLNIPGLSFIGVMIGNGDGTFQPLVQYSAGDGAPAIGDFTGDGIPDIINADASGNLYLLKGNGDGTFGFAVTIPTGNGISLAYLAVGDFNNDNKLDVALVSLASTNVSVLLGNGDGTFQPAKNFVLTSPASSVAVGDFNNDGKLDVAVQVQDQIAVLLGNGDGTLRSAVYSSTGVVPIAGEPSSIVVGELNNDGKLDLLATFPGLGNVVVLLGNGDGTFQTGGIWGANGFGESAAIGDFNGTGRPDIVSVASVGNANASLLVNRAVPAPRASFSPTGVTFATSQVGLTSAAQVITLTNTGDGPLTISSIAINGTNSGDFSQTNTCPASPASLMAQATCQISVAFTPTGTGNRLATITVADNATTGQGTLSLLGAATDFSIAAATGANCPTGGNCTTTAVITEGQTATYNLQISTLAGFNANVTLSCSGAPAPATCATSPTTVGSSSYAFTVSVSGTSGTQMFPPIDRRSGPRGGRRYFPSPVLLIVALVLLLAGLGLAQQSRRRLLLPAFTVLVLALLYACGGGSTASTGGGGANTPPPQTPVSATLTVTATSNGVKRTLPLSLTINP